jgi:pilus assembly protein CpaB
MRARTLILVLLAVFFAGGTALLARAWLNAQRAAPAAQAAPVPPRPVKSVLVAHGAIQRGHILKAQDLAWQPWPDDGVNPSYIQRGARSLETFVGSVARDRLAPGEPITDAKIVAPGSRGFLAAVLRPGMRAVSVPVNATSGISGFIFPGDQVDILITYPVPVDGNGSKMEHRAAETILHNVRVIGIDQRLDGKEGEAIVAHTATLEVTPKESEVIALASEMGKLSLSLRSLAREPGPNGESVASAGADSADSATAATYTLDSEVSPLLPKPLRGNGPLQNGQVTILRGNGKSSESSGVHPASRGS